ncbi:MAG: small, acid-soluble spore protein, alpha/beta type [Peptococcaceae bacterium]
MTKEKAEKNLSKFKYEVAQEMGLFKEKNKNKKIDNSKQNR